MSTLLISIVSAGVILGFLVLVHEWAHYLVAKACGVTVKIFSIGFGKRLAGFEHNGTDYRISALPFGGYVKMAGDNPMEGSTGDPGEFLEHPRWQRFAIAAAGPLMNILVAILLLTGVYMFHYEHASYDDQAPTIGEIAPDSAAQHAGLRLGDKIIAVGSKQDARWDDVRTAIALSPNQPLTLTVDRGGMMKQISVTPKAESPSEIGEAGIGPATDGQSVYQVAAGSPAEKAGIQRDDLITAIDGHPVYSGMELRSLVQASGGAALHISALREGKPLALTVTPHQAEQEGKQVFQIGVIPIDPFTISKLPLGESLVRASVSSKQNAMLIVELLRKMAQRKVSIKSMSGPIGIVQISGQAARAKGWTPLVMLTALISINLGVLNLFPIPILDGGVILLLIIEGLIRRDISLNLKERIYQASFVFLVLFAGVVIFNDIAKLHG